MPASGDAGERSMLVSRAESRPDVRAVSAGRFFSTSGSILAIWSSDSDGVAGEDASVSVGDGNYGRAALNADDVDAVAVAEVGVDEAFAGEVASGADGHVCEVQVADDGVVFAGASEFAFV